MEGKEGAAAVAALIENNLFDAAIMPQLEDYVALQVRAPAASPPARWPQRRAQVRKGTYDFEANRCGDRSPRAQRASERACVRRRHLLHLYALEPDKIHVHCLSRVRSRARGARAVRHAACAPQLLTKALMQLPALDFAMCCHLVPERVVRARRARCWRGGPACACARAARGGARELDPAGGAAAGE